MRVTALRVLVLLACVASINCGSGSSTSSPTSPSTGGNAGSGSTGGSSGGATETVRATTPITDSLFSDGDWDDVVETYSASGTGGGAHLTYNGQVGGDYRQISIRITSASGSDAKLAVFAINRQVAYFPSTDGAILYIDYSESSINQAAGFQYSAPAIRQNGKLYTLVPGEKAFATPDSAWTDHSLAHLTQNDFRTIASATDHPDFSSGRIEFGFMRLQAGAGDTKGGIDNYRLVLFRK